MKSRVAVFMTVSILHPSPPLRASLSDLPNKSALLRLSHIFFQFGSRRARGTRAARVVVPLSFDIWGFIWQHHAPMGVHTARLPVAAAAVDK